jgi:hypothetical protein
MDSEDIKVNLDRMRIRDRNPGQRKDNEALNPGLWLLKPARIL